MRLSRVPTWNCADEWVRKYKFRKENNIWRYKLLSATGRHIGVLLWPKESFTWQFDEGSSGGSHLIILTPSWFGGVMVPMGIKWKLPKMILWCSALIDQFVFCAKIFRWLMIALEFLNDVYIKVPILFSWIKVIFFIIINFCGFLFR